MNGNTNVDMREEKTCIHCGVCTEYCELLKKYQLKLSDIEELEKIAYHCFLCEKCKEKCPVGINGKEIFLDLRRKQAAGNGGEILEDGYEMLIKEKEDYIFRNYKNITPGTVLFPGCSFPSFFPKTTQFLADLLMEEYGIGTIYDCCGKPISELGLEAKEEQIINQMNIRLRKADVKEVVMLCPNCYYYLSDKLDVKVTNIFDFMRKVGVGEKLVEKEIHLFMPCPDKSTKIWLEHLKYYLPENVDEIDNITCCGLGGCARAKEPEISKGFTEQLKEKNYSSVYTYCSSCAGKFGRDGMKNIHHVLSDILGIEEGPDVKNAMSNRMASKTW